MTVYVLTEICHQRSEWLSPKFNIWGQFFHEWNERKEKKPCKLTFCVYNLSVELELYVEHNIEIENERLFFYILQKISIFTLNDPDMFQWMFFERKKKIQFTRNNILQLQKVARGLQSVYSSFWNKFNLKENENMKSLLTLKIWFHFCFL